MLDYRGIEALYTVVEQQSFELAAKKLFITQSAISQRIKGLETFYGETVLVRALPYKPTRLGELLLGHFKNISLLEDSLKQEINKDIIPKISIAINRDSLETWFLKLLKEKEIFQNLLIEILADDQELTLDYFKKGVVTTCISTSEKAIIGANAVFLGNMDYLLVASPEFKNKYFGTKKHKDNLLKAPAIKFDKNDRLHERYLEKFFKITSEEISFNIVPSVQCFKQFAIEGYGYGLIPRIDIIEELKRKELIQLYPNKIWKIPIYLHYLDINADFYKKFIKNINYFLKNKLTL